MVHIEPDGRLILTIDLPGATRVEVVGTFTGWHEQRLPMTADGDGRWRLELTPATGQVLFRYLVDDRYWLLDAGAHGTHTNALGQDMSRVWVPPTRIEPDSIAA
jgi:1,4-alpha-glucan branching enzyme